jgi:hypothetical protein
MVGVVVVVVVMGCDNSRHLFSRSKIYFHKYRPAPPLQVLTANRKIRFTKTDGLPQAPFGYIVG